MKKSKINRTELKKNVDQDTSDQFKKGDKDSKKAAETDGKKYVKVVGEKRKAVSKLRLKPG